MACPRRAAALSPLLTNGWTGIGFDLVLRGVLPPLSRAVLNNVLDAGLFAVALASLVPQTRLVAALAWRPLQVPGYVPRYGRPARYQGAAIRRSITAYLSA